MKKAPKMKVKQGKQLSVKVGKFATGGFMKSFTSGFEAGGKMKDEWDKARLAKADADQDAEQDAND